MNLGGAWFWAVPAVMLVAFGLFLSIPEDPAAAPGTASAPYSETVLVPEVSRVLSHTSTVEARSEHVEGEQRRIETPPKLPEADGAAQSAESVLFSAAFAESSVTVSMPAGTGVPGCEETNSCFVPTAASVDVGGSVTWTNDDSVVHTVWAGDLQADASAVGHDYPNGFQSGLINPGDSFTVSDLKEGYYPYYDTVHPWRTGSITVGAGGTPVESRPRIAITEHSLPYGRVCAFDAEGNLYGGNSNYVFRADVSEGVVTKWIIPDDLSFSDCGDADSSGRFYFTIDPGNRLLRLNPDDDSFTTFSLRYYTNSFLDIDSSDNVYIHQPEYTYVLEGSRQAKVFVSSLYINVDYDQDDDWFTCVDQCDDVYAACSDACYDAEDACEQTCGGSESCEDACGDVADQCTDACGNADDACIDVCYAGPGRIDGNDSVYHIVSFLGSGVSGPATVTVLSSNSSVLGTTTVLPNQNGLVFGHIKIPTDITAGVYDRESGTWDIPPGPYSTTGRHTLVLEDLSQTASTVFELDPDRIITPAPEELDQHTGGTRYHFALAAKLDPATDNLTMFYSGVGHYNYRVIAMDSGSLYLQDGTHVAKFDLESGKLLEWYVGSNIPRPGAYGVHGDKVYYVERLKYRTMLAELDTQENTLRKWTLPRHQYPYSIAVDDRGDVFMAFGQWLKFTPSTGAFTEFGRPHSTLFETGPQGVIHWSSDSSGGSIQ